MGFYTIVLPFGLSVYLWIDGDGESLFNIEEIIWEEPKFRGENWPLVTDNRM